MDQKSYASIENKNHPYTKQNSFDFEDIKLDGKENFELVKSMLEKFQTILVNDNDGSGEWEWLQKNKQNNFINALTEKNVEKISNYLTNMFRNEATYGYLSPSFSDAIVTPDNVKSDILCNIDSCIEFSDLNNLSKLTSTYGNPYGLKVGDNYILPDTPRHYYYSYNIKRLLNNNKPPTVIEIGGGYGGLCLQNWRRFDGKCTLVNIDLYPALVTTYFYLKKNYIPVNFITKKNSDLKSNEVNLMSASEVKNLSQIVSESDIIFNSRSLCEMHTDTISEYFQFINASKAKYFYHENSNFLLFPESERHIEVIADEFPINEKIYTLKSKYLTPFTGGKGRYREYIYEKC